MLRDDEGRGGEKSLGKNGGNPDENWEMLGNSWENLKHLKKWEDFFSAKMGEFARLVLKAKHSCWMDAKC